MVETYLRQSALAHLGLEGRTTEDGENAADAVSLAEVAYPCMVNLRGKADDDAFMAAAETLLGCQPPSVPNTVAEGSGDLKVIWLSPEEWWVLDEAASGPEAERALGDRLREGLTEVHAAVTEVGEGRTRIRVKGSRARDLLAKGCPLDFHPRVFHRVGLSAQTVMAKADVLVHLSGEEQFDLFVLRSFSDYLWHWLEDAAKEYNAGI